MHKKVPHKKSPSHNTKSKNALKQKKSKKKKSQVSKRVDSELVAAIHEADDEDAHPMRAPAPPPPSRFNFVSSIEKRLVEYVHKTVETVRYSAYKLGGKYFDSSRGIYVVDCSDYVDNILENVHPKAFWSLADATGSEKPTSQHYYEFFKGLSAEPSYYWNKVDDVEKLEPGDILVFRKKTAMNRQTGAGHVMVVMNKPVFDEDAYLVRVADSAPSGHSADTRLPHKSGIGIGTILLKVNPDTGKPSAYAWKVGSRWKNVNFAMARPVGMS